MAARSLGADGLEPVELAIRTAMIRLGASLLEGLLGLDPGHRGPRVGCGAGHRAEFVSYREKTIDTVLGPVRTRRAWYHYAACGHGLAPRDADLGVASASMSAGFTQTTLDDDGHPARDPQSSSYLATFAPAERFAAWRTGVTLP